jgi:hypothetical protein
VEVGRSWSEAGQGKSKRYYLKKQTKKAKGLETWLKGRSCKHEVLRLTFSATKNKNKKRARECSSPRSPLSPAECVFLLSPYNKSSLSQFLTVSHL